MKEIETNFNNKSFPLIDIGKIIAAIFVVAIHTGFLRHFGVVGALLYNGLYRLAVPYFFVASGYLMFSKLHFSGKGKLLWNDVNRKIFFRFILKLVKIFLLWESVYVIWKILKGLLFDNFNIISFLRYCINIFLGPTTGALWYVLASIFAYLLLYLILHYISNKIFLIIFLMGCWLFHALIYNYRWLPIPYMDFIYQQQISISIFIDTFFRAMPLLLIGYLIARKGICTIKQAVIGLSVSTLIFILELLFLYRFATLHILEYPYGICIVPVIYFMFQFVLGVSFKTNIIINTAHLRTLSSQIYFVHPLFISIISLLPYNFGLGKFVLVLALSVAWGAIVILSQGWMKKYENHRIHSNI